MTPYAIIVDQEFEPDDPVESPHVGDACPEKCKKVCVTACPTGAVNGDGTVNPQKCICYLTHATYVGITPLEYTSINSYNMKDGKPTDSLCDYQTVPDNGSNNPFFTDYTYLGFSGFQIYGSYHGGGSPIMEQIAITSQFDIKARKNIVKKLAGIED